MINLLPPQEKKEIAQEKNYRLILILGFLVLLFLLSLFLTLFSIKVYVSSQSQNQKILADSEEEKFKISEVRGFEKEIELINQKLLNLNSFYEDQSDFAELLKKISETLPEQIYLTNASLNPVTFVPAKAAAEEKKSLQVSLAGFCPNRETLFELKKRLEAEENFKEIYFPPSNWIKSKDIDFNITFKFEL